MEDTVISEDYHPDSFLSRFTRAGNMMPTPQRRVVRSWLHDVDSFEDGWVSTNSLSEDVTSSPRVMQSVSPEEPSNHGHHRHIDQHRHGDRIDEERSSSGGVSIQSEDWHTRSLDTSVLRDPQVNIPPKKAHVVHYQSGTAMSYDDKSDAATDDFEGKEEGRGVTLASSPKLRRPSPKKADRASPSRETSKENGITTKKVCTKRGHLFKSDYATYCDGCGDNLDGRRKYTCVAGDCGIVCCGYCAKQDETRRPNVGYEEWLAKHGSKI